ncbi:MAG: isoprenylcysteine carboxylmethyltransferase family protein [Chthoniobacteraceae bacterium]
MDLAAIISLLWVASEVLFTRVLSAKGGQRKDASTLGMLWVVITGSIFLAQFLRSGFNQARIPDPTHILYGLGITILLGGITIRLLAIWTLRRFFTVQVTIQEDHQLIRSGLYHHLRHPSYTGALLAFFGLGLTIRNWLSLLVVTVPITLAFLKRIRIEEAALREKFGPQYEAYQRETKALIPGIY